MKKSSKVHASTTLGLIGTIMSVIGIIISSFLMLLMIVSFSGTQTAARDSERKVDIDSISNVLDARYANIGSYPTAEQLNNPSWRSANNIALKPENLADPKQPTSEKLVSSAPTPNDYSYFYEARGCTGDKCEGYTITANLERSSDTADQQTYSRSSR